ncbi:hypothetical protein GA102_24750 [Vibrio alginolyticus]|nr:hypothetical protein [Vibrio alginolyticus]
MLLRVSSPNKQFKRDSQRLAPSLQVSLVLMAQCFRLGWRRCSPLNWALVVHQNSSSSSNSSKYSGE